MSTGLIIDIADLFQKTFGKRPYIVPGLSNTTDSSDIPYSITEQQINKEKEFTNKGFLIKEKYRGVDVLLPIRFYDESSMIMYLPYCVIRIGGKKNIIETDLSERIGSVKELFNTDDYEIDVKGFLISEDRKFPETDLVLLRNLYELKKAVKIDNALTNIFLMDNRLGNDQQRVVITSFDLPEVQGGRENIRPFTMTLQSDISFVLEIEN